MLIQSSFSDLEYASKGYVTRRDRLMRDLDTLKPWPALLATIEPVYPKPGEPEPNKPSDHRRTKSEEIGHGCDGAG